MCEEEHCQRQSTKPGVHVAMRHNSAELHALAHSTSYSWVHAGHCQVTNATNRRISILCIHKAGTTASSKTAHETQQEQDVESENCITCHEYSMSQRDQPGTLWREWVIRQAAKFY